MDERVHARMMAVDDPRVEQSRRSMSNGAEQLVECC
jgi:hypothetical protein